MGLIQVAGISETFGQEAYILDQVLEPGLPTSDQFAWGMDTDGDRLLISDPMASPGSQFNAGALHAYRWDAQSSIWASDGYITALSPSPGSRFGWFHAIGQDKVVASERSDCTGACPLLVFQRTGDNSWPYLGQLVQPASVNGGTFGSSISMSGELVAVGGGRIDERECVLIYDLSGGLQPIRTILEPIQDMGSVQLFGSALDLQDEVLLIGAPGDAELGMDAGAAYVHRRDLGGNDEWGLVKKVLPSDGSTGDRFGFSLRTRDGLAAVSAIRKVVSDSTAGQVYVLGRDHGGVENWGELDAILPPAPRNNMEFGRSLEISGVTILVGTPKDLSGKGSVHIHTMTGQHTWSLAQVIEGNEPFERFGNSVRTGGLGFVAAAPWNNAQDFNTGMARSYRLSPAGVVSLDVSGMHVFPNPFTTNFRLIGIPEGASSMEIYDAQGQLVRAIRLHERSVTCEVPWPEGSTGVYSALIRDRSGQWLVRMKLIAQ
ncbi:MAG: T9SS type A sorting domain-containing protein [Flavobacteriales bacterium]|nr:T9SS type A sorting domain-containing protein [Flavobacteriales bacterium]